MKRIIAFVALLALAACACPRTDMYDDTPYGERTAGTGMVDEGCFRRLVED